MSADQLPGLNEPKRQTGKIPQQVDTAFSFQAADGDERQWKARSRNDALLQTMLRADEDDPALVIARLPLLRDGNGGVDVPPGPTTPDHERIYDPAPLVGVIALLRQTRNSQPKRRDRTPILLPAPRMTI